MPTVSITRYALTGSLVLTTAVGVTPETAAAQARSTAAAEIGTSPLERHLRRDIGVLAHDSLRGRATPSPGLESAARFVADEFARAGLEPFLRDTHVWRYPVADTEIIPESVTVVLPPQPPVRLGGTLALLDDHGAARQAKGDLVLVTGEITASTVAHLDFSGAILLVPRSGAPGGLDRSQIYQWAGPLMESNPLAIIYVSDLPDTSLRALNAELPRKRRWIGMDPLELRQPLRVSHGIFVARPEVVAPVLSARGIDVRQLLAETASPLRVQRLAGQEVRVSAPRRQVARMSAPLVVGLLPGSDPRLRDELVVVSAHLDHLGVGNPAANGDSVYNGADDNASGVAVMLAVARELRAGGTTPRRSVLFIATSGEESGFWGSDFFVGSTGTPVERMVANINVDGVGRPAWTDSVAVLGGAWSTLGEAALVVARKANVGITPSFGPHARYAQSDHYSFARRGIPSVHVYSGKLNSYYHSPDDELEVIDFPWLTRLTRYVSALVAHTGNEDVKPTWTDSYRQTGKTPW